VVTRGPLTVSLVCVCVGGGQLIVKMGRCRPLYFAKDRRWVGTPGHIAVCVLNAPHLNVVLHLVSCFNEHTVHMISPIMSR
jgi:hypothetical protein